MISQARAALEKVNDAGKLSDIKLPMATTDYTPIVAKVTEGSADCVSGGKLTPFDNDTYALTQEHA